MTTCNVNSLKFCRLSLFLIGVLGLIVCGVQTARSQTETILFSFDGPNGAWPMAGVVLDGKGNIFGTTELGGTMGEGNVFKIDPAGNLTVLHSFGRSADGSYPHGSLLLHTDHNLYGTTSQGGAFGVGTVFRIDRKGNETVIYSFGSQPGDGSAPWADLIVDRQGNLFGTTSSGGAFGEGTVFELSSTGQETVLYSFGAYTQDGTSPFCGLVRDAKGNLYGTTNGGGAYKDGAVFELSANGVEKILHSFAGGKNDGYEPWAGLVRGDKGNLYGTAAGGSYGLGIVYKVTRKGEETVFYNFGTQVKDGQNPYAGLRSDKEGNLYGTTVLGGGFGNVFMLTPAGQLTQLHDFQLESEDGAFPYGRIFLDKTGNLYGTTLQGGSTTNGTVFKVTP
jgi:uncharacterized repeat protein (TIGR03803 family)